MEDAPHILVVEDDEGTREVLADYLEGCGYAVTTASDGDQALGLLQEEASYDLVLLDVVMPGKSGLVVLEAIHELKKRSPVVLMTAWGQLQTRIHALKLGGTELLTKPFSTEALDNVVGRLLRGHAS